MHLKPPPAPVYNQFTCIARKYFLSAKRVGHVMAANFSTCKFNVNPTIQFYTRSFLIFIGELLRTSSNNVIFGGRGFGIFNSGTNHKKCRGRKALIKTKVTVVPFRNNKISFPEFPFTKAPS